MTRLSDEALRKLDAEATKGPWRSETFNDGEGPPDCVMSGELFIASCHGGMRQPAINNANLIAAARDLPAEVLELRAALRFYADISKYPAPLTGGMGDLYFDCGKVARKALGVE